MSRPSRLGAYAKLSATYYQDDAVLSVGTDAELLYVRGLAFCAGQMSDGFISDAQVKLIAVGIRSCAVRARELQESGLWLRVDGGFVARGWQKWNKTAEEIGSARRKDRERKARSRTETEGEFQADSERNPGGVTLDSLSEIGQDRIGQDKIANDADTDADFDEFWSIYPKRVAKRAALKAWASATKRADVEDILTGARKYARHPDVTRDGGKFIKNPATWLNGDCWEDETPNAAPATVTVLSAWDLKVGGGR